VCGWALASCTLQMIKVGRSLIISCPFSQCQVCKTASSRRDRFLDISLPIRNLSSLSEAFLAYTKPEVLEGDNAYYCETCKQKCTALKVSKRGRGWVRQSGHAKRLAISISGNLLQEAATCAHGAFAPLRF
jgi:ubiquitin C-terminal hydrolase